MSKVSFAVQWALSHSGKDYKAGDDISLAKKEADPLLACGVLLKKENEKANPDKE